MSPCGYGVRIPLSANQPPVFGDSSFESPKQPATSASSRSLPAIGCRVPSACASPPSDAPAYRKIGVVDRDGGVHRSSPSRESPLRRSLLTARGSLARSRRDLTQTARLDQVPWIGAAQRPKIVSAILPRSARCRGADARISSPSIPTRFSPSPNSLTSAATIRCVISA